MVKSPTKEIGVASDYGRTSELRADEFIPLLRGQRGIKKFREMRENDATVGAILFAIEQMLRPIKWEWMSYDDSPQARRAQQIVTDSFENLQVPFSDFISDVLSFFTYGFSLFEPVYSRRTTNGDILLRKLAPRAQWTIEELAVDQNGEYIGAQQRALQRSVFLPANKTVLFRTTSVNRDPAGRALDPKTLIPTPNGWRTIGDLKTGDALFGSDGKIIYVTATQRWADRPCYEIEFNSGQKVVADANHLWRVQDKNGRPKNAFRLRTTEQMASGGNRANSTAETMSWSIPWAQALEYPRQFLPLDPYYLGYWLGDGCSASGKVATHVDDVDFLVSQFESSGFKCRIEANGTSENGKTIYVGSDQGKWHTSNPSNILGMLGVKNNKHIPEAYLRGDTEQRMALLQGLMDSDGSINNNKSCEFTNTNESLAYGVAELVRSLGYSCNVRNSVTDHGTPQWRVCFTVDMQPFKLPRKAEQCKTVRARKNHYVKTIRKVENRDTVCIEVSAADRMFLCTESMIPTHNSALRNAYISYYRLNHIQEVEAVAIERELNGLPVVRIPSEYLLAEATAEQKQVKDALAQIAREVKRNEQGFVMLPSDLIIDEEGKLSDHYMVDLKLLASTGTRDIDTNRTIIRYQQDIARSVMADFIMLGTNDRGSFAMSESKSGLFLKALTGYMNNISETLRRQLFPPWMMLNGIDPLYAPIPRHGSIAPVDLEKVGEFVQRIAQAGAPLFPDDALENELRRGADLPPRSTASPSLPIDQNDAE